MSIGDRLRQIRVERGEIQEVFARNWNVSLSAIKAYENNQRPMPTTLVIELCTQLEISANWLLLGEGTKNSNMVRELIKRSVDSIEQYLERNNYSFDLTGKVEAITLMFEYLSEHPNTSEKFINSLLDDSCSPSADGIAHHDTA